MGGLFCFCLVTNIMIKGLTFQLNALKLDHYHTDFSFYDHFLFDRIPHLPDADQIAYANRAV